MVHSPLTTGFSITTDHDPNPRNLDAIDSIGHHHAAGTSLAVALGLFAPGGRTVSPNYCIRGRDIICVVPEEYRPWTSSSAQDDGRSITYEIINSTGDPTWSFDPETIASVIALDADIMRRYPKVQARHALPGFWEHKNLYQWFGRSYATSCAGPSFDINAIINAVKIGTDMPLSDADLKALRNYLWNQPAYDGGPSFSQAIKDLHIEHKPVLRDGVLIAQRQDNANGVTLAGEIARDVTALGGLVRSLVEATGADPDLVAETVRAEVEKGLANIDARVADAVEVTLTDNFDAVLAAVEGLSPELRADLARRILAEPAA